MLPPIVCTPPSLTPFSFLNTCSSFFPLPCLNPIAPSKENPSQGNFQWATCQLPLHSVRIIASAVTPRGWFVRTQPETKSPNRLSTDSSDCASGGNLVQSTIKWFTSLYSSIHISTCILIHNSLVLFLLLNNVLSCSLQLDKRDLFLS